MKSTLGVALLILALSEAVYINDVAFSAVLTSHKTYDAGQTVVYDKVYVNDGNGYNPLTGLFTAPKAGRYRFYFNALTQSAGEFWLDLLRNDVVIVSAFASSTFGYDSAGNTVILNLKKGDIVKIVAHRTSELYGTSGELYTSFTGELTTTYVL